MNQYNLTSNFKSSQGMSLMEVMIAVTLLAFVMLGIITVTENSMNTKERTVEINRDNLAIENVISRLEWDISQIYSPLYFSTRSLKNLDPTINQCTNCQDIFQYYEGNPRFRYPNQDGIPVPIFSSKDQSEFTFLTASNRRKSVNARQSYLAWVQYSIDDEKEDSEPTPSRPSSDKINQTNKAFVRRMIVDNIFENDSLDWEKTRPSYLLNNVEKVEFEFWNPQTNKFESNLMTIPLGESLLRGIKLYIKWYDSNGNERETTRFFRPIWPFFDAQAQALINAQNTQPNNNTSGNNPTGPSATNQLTPEGEEQ